MARKSAPSNPPAPEPEENHETDWDTVDEAKQASDTAMDNLANALHGEAEAGAHQTDVLDADEAQHRAEQASDGAPPNPEHVFDAEAWKQDTDNTHQDGGDGFHQEEYISAEDLPQVAAEEAHNAGDTDNGSLHPGDIAARINAQSATLTNTVMAPAGRDETIVGEHPEEEKGLRPPASVEGTNRSDDAGRPFDGGYLHTVDKGDPVGMGVNEHVPAPTASGAVPEGMRNMTMPVPVTTAVLPDARIAERQARAGGKLTLDPRHHAILDAAENLWRSNARKFSLGQTGGSIITAMQLVEAGFLTAIDVVGGAFMPNTSKAFELTEPPTD